MFSTVTSAFFNRERTISRPRGDLRFNVSDFLLALNWWKYQGSLSGWPGRRRRPGSPVVGFSILTTSAPSQARDSVQDGPASNWVKSTTLIPSRQSSSTPISAIARSSWAAMLEYLLAARNPPDSRRAVHRKEDSPGIHRSQYPCDLGRAVALSGAAGEPREGVSLPVSRLSGKRVIVFDDQPQPFQHDREDLLGGVKQFAVFPARVLPADLRRQHDAGGFVLHR